MTFKPISLVTITTLFCAICISLTNPHPAYAQCQWQKTDSNQIFNVQNTGFFQYWAGQIIEYCATTGSEPDGNTPVIVLITHVTDKSDYRCREKIRFRLSELADLKATSFALRKCR